MKKQHILTTVLGLCAFFINSVNSMVNVNHARASDGSGREVVLVGENHIFDALTQRPGMSLQLLAPVITYIKSLSNDKKIPFILELVPQFFRQNTPGSNISPSCLALTKVARELLETGNTVLFLKLVDSRGKASEYMNELLDAFEDYMVQSIPAEEFGKYSSDPERYENIPGSGQAFKGIIPRIQFHSTGSVMWQLQESSLLRCKLPKTSMAGT